MKHYTDDLFIRLLDEVEKQGGSLLPERCAGKKFRLKMKSGNTMRWKDYWTTGCGYDSRFDVPYEPLLAHDAEKRVVTVCAVDDMMHLWPRFATIHTEEAE